MKTIFYVLTFICIVFFIEDSLRCFKVMYNYQKEKGFSSETICYIKSPHSIHPIIKSNYMMSVVLIVFVVVCCSWFFSIYCIIQLNMVSLGLLVSYFSYIFVIIGFTVSSIFSGVKVLETGLVKGLKKIPWETIDGYSWSSRKYLFSNKIKTVIRIKSKKHQLPIHINVTTGNIDFVESIINEKCEVV